MSIAQAIIPNLATNKTGPGLNKASNTATMTNEKNTTDKAMSLFLTAPVAFNPATIAPIPSIKTVPTKNIAINK